MYVCKYVYMCNPGTFRKIEKQLIMFKYSQMHAVICVHKHKYIQIYKITKSD